MEKEKRKAQVQEEVLGFLVSGKETTRHPAGVAWRSEGKKEDE